jgi:hypothetical protein
MKHYKVYLNLYNKNNERIEHEEQKLIISKLIKQDNKTFCMNLNKDKNKHYPIYYDRVYYFGQPIVLTAIREDKLKELLEFFKEQGLKFWITPLYEMYNFEDLKAKFKNLRMEDINKERVYLFENKISLVNEYKKGYAIIQNNIEIDKIINETK